jgi:hypothetical protein
MIFAVVALTLLQFTGPTGVRIDLNGEAMTSIRDPHSMSGGHWVKGTNCVIVMSNGRFIAVKETCDEVRQAIGARTGPCRLVCGKT